MIFDLNFKLAFDRWELTPLANNNYVINKMRPVLNFDASYEYLINKQFSAFAQVNNIASQYYSKYYDFKNFGLNFIVGVTYSFGDEPLRKVKTKK
jgi:outer membrane receptor protein involved in Fe transport